MSVTSPDGKADPAPRLTRQGLENGNNLIGQLVSVSREMEERSQGSGSSSVFEERDVLREGLRREEELERKSNAGSGSGLEVQPSASSKSGGPGSHLDEEKSSVKSRGSLQGTPRGCGGSGGNPPSFAASLKKKKQGRSRELDPMPFSSGSNSGTGSTESQLLEFKRQLEEAARAGGFTTEAECSRYLALLSDMEANQQRLQRKVAAAEESNKQARFGDAVVKEIGQMAETHATIAQELKTKVEHAKVAKREMQLERDRAREEAAEVTVQEGLRGESIRRELEHEITAQKNETAKIKAEKDEAKFEASREMEQLRLTTQTLAEIVHAKQAKHDSDLAGIQELVQRTKARMSKEDVTTNDDAVLNLSTLVASSRDLNKEMDEDLRSLRVHMVGLGNVEGTDALLEDPVEGSRLQFALDSAQKILQASGDSSSSTSTLQRPRKMLNVAGRKAAKPGSAKLSSIEEEDDFGSLVESLGVSGTVSDEGDCVGDLRDFDDDAHGIGGDAATEQRNLAHSEKVQSLRKEMAQQVLKEELLREEVAAREARFVTKVSALQELLNDARLNEDAAELEAMKLKELALPASKAEALLQSTELEEAQVRLREMEQETARKSEKTAELEVQLEAQTDADAESLQEQICYLMEAKRIAEARLADLKREMASMERRHDGIMADLKQELANTGGSEVTKNTGTSRETSQTADDSEWKQQFREAVQDRNVLTHKLECAELQWKSQIESAKQQHAAEMAKLLREHQAKVVELEHTARKGDEVANLQQQLELVRQEQAEAKAQAAAYRTDSSSMSIFLSSLRCPVRADIGGAGAKKRALFCQETCWHVINATSSMVGLLCHFETFDIMEATKKACSIWGSSLLMGKPLTKLVSDGSRAAWLKRALTTHQMMAEADEDDIPGFVVRFLGCIEFQSRAGQPFDASVVAAHLPAEPARDKEAAVLIVVEPMQMEEDVRRHPGAQATYSVASEDVSPNDSVSCVM